MLVLLGACAGTSPANDPSADTTAAGEASAPSTNGDEATRPCGLAYEAPSSPSQERTEATLLPADFRVYVIEGSVVNQPYPGADERVLPTSNPYTGNDGCYVACYSHDRARSVYGVGDDIYVNGQVRVKGSYEGRVCQPTVPGQDLSRLCGEFIPSCGTGCWSGGDTGGWFGL